MSVLRRIGVGTSLVIIVGSPLLTALTQRDDSAGAAAGCFACSGFIVFLIVAVIALNIALLVWVARDAKARGMDSGYSGCCWLCSPE